MPLDPEALTWTGLLGQWMQFAQASLALPRNAEGDRWRASVPAIINLQAVTFALADLARLAPAEQNLALDKAELLIRENTQRLNEIWTSDAPRQEAVDEIIHDAALALHAAQHAAALRHQE